MGLVPHNAVHLASDGNLLIDARNTWTTYNVNRRSGSIIWQLGGKSSSFALRAAAGQQLNTAGDIFAWQHDPEALGHSEYTFFDNESACAANTGAGATSEFGLSRVVRVRLVGWGSLPYFSEFDRSGRLLLNAQFPAGVNSYRLISSRGPPAATPRGTTPRGTDAADLRRRDHSPGPALRRTRAPGVSES